MIQIPLLTIISGVLTISVRLTGLMLFAPFFGSVAIPTRVKAILVLAITLLLYPSVGHDIGTYNMAQWPILIFMEFLIGVGMGIATNIVFEAIQLSGQVLGIQMGYSLVNILDPQTQVDTTVISVFYQSIVMLLFLRMDVHYLFLSPTYWLHPTTYLCCLLCAVPNWICFKYFTAAYSQHPGCTYGCAQLQYTSRLQSY